MPDEQRLECSQSDGVTVVRFVDSKILDFNIIEQIATELNDLIDREKTSKLLLNLCNVEFLSSAALNKLIVLDKKMKKLGGKVALAELQPQVYEVFAITQLTQLFPIEDRESAGVKILNEGS